jgi:hypothetical protein
MLQYPVKILLRQNQLNVWLISWRLYNGAPDQPAVPRPDIKITPVAAHGPHCPLLRIGQQEQLVWVTRFREIQQTPS